MKPRFTGRQAASTAQAGARKRQITIRNLIANIRQTTGRTPSDEEIASFLAMSVSRVRLHLKGLRP